MMLFPKPLKPERGTKACRDHMAEVAKQPCVICGSWPVIVHHCIHDRFSQRRASDKHTIPLCWDHHDAQSPTGIHHAPEVWRETHGPDWRYLALVRAVMTQ